MPRRWDVLPPPLLGRIKAALLQSRKRAEEEGVYSPSDHSREWPEARVRAKIEIAQLALETPIDQVLSEVADESAGDS